MIWRDTLKDLARRVDELERRKSYQQDMAPDSIKLEHILNNPIVRGLAADRPDGSTRTKAYFATDTGVLSIWDGTQWLTTTLT